MRRFFALFPLIFLAAAFSFIGCFRKLQISENKPLETQLRLTELSGGSGYADYFGADFSFFDEFEKDLGQTGILTAREFFFYLNDAKDSAGVDFIGTTSNLQNSLISTDPITTDDDDFSFDATALLEELDGRDDRGIEGGNGETDEKEEKPEYSFSDGRGEVRRFSYDGEQMTARRVRVGVGEDGGEIFEVEVVSVYGSKIRRRFFDSNARLVRSEVLSLGDSSRSLKKVSGRSYTYSAEDGSLLRSEESLFDSGRSVSVRYAPSGLVEAREEFSLDSDSGKKSPVKRDSYTYDEQKRVLSEEHSRWFPDGATFSTKKVYEYTDISENPDYSYYEDGNLRLVRSYDGGNDYYERTFMDGGFSVLSYFEDGVKFSEVVYFGDAEVRRKYFD